MTNNQYVEMVYKREKNLIYYCDYLKYHNNKKDLIQDLYIKLLSLEDIDKYVYNNRPNFAFVFTVLRNMIFNISNKKKNNKTVLYNITENIEVEDVEYEDEGQCIAMIYDEINSMPEGTGEEFFKKHILKIYYEKNMTIRQIHKEIDISPHYTQPIIHNFKKQCRANIK